MGQRHLRWSRSEAPAVPSALLASAATGEYKVVA